MRSEAATEHVLIWRSLGWGGFYAFVLAAWAGVFLIDAQTWQVRTFGGYGLERDAAA